MTQHRQLYVCPRVHEVKGELVPLAAWVLREVTTSSERSPTWIEMTSGGQSLARLIPDALSLFDQGNNAVSLTITSRPVGPDIGPALPATTVGLDLVASGSYVNMCMPIGGDHGDIWCWARRYRDSFSIDGKETRFRRPALRWAIAVLFNDRRITSENVDPNSTLLRQINALDKPVELWVRPTWRAAELFPDAFPVPAEDRGPVTMPDDVRNRIREAEELKARRAKQERQRKLDEQIASDNDKWCKDRDAKEQRLAREAAREREIQRRVRAEMDN